MLTVNETPLPYSLSTQLSPWEARLINRNVRGARVAIWLVLFLYPTFGILDYLMAPEGTLVWLMSGRALVMLCSLVMLGYLKHPTFIRHTHVLTACYMFLVACGICLMVCFMGGLASPYYAGLNLVMIGCGLLYVWPPSICVTIHTCICVGWLGFNLLFGEVSDLVTSMSNALFLASTACIVTTGQIFNYRRLELQHNTQTALEDTKSDLENAHEQLKQLDSFKNRFFANITHELKTPLALILSSLELMIRGELGGSVDEQRKSCLQMQRSGAKLLKLINDLLDLTKLEDSNLRLKVKKEEIVSWTRQLIDEVKPLAERKGVSVHFLTEKINIDVWCDLERLERVIINLLSNAMKFTDTGGQVQVRLIDCNHSVRFEIQDTGKGFKAEDSDKIFQRFYQTDMGATRKYGGTGIGLALAQELVELHQGKIWAKGEEGIGATFFVELLKGNNHFGPDVIDILDDISPRSEVDVTAAVALPIFEDIRLLDMQEATERRILERDQDEEERGRTVLIAEDNPDITRLLHLALRRHFKVLAATDGQKAWELIERFNPDLIITDLMMPIMDGMELTQKVKSSEAFSHIPLVMLSARDGIQDEMRQVGHMADAYMSKPFSTRKLNRLAVSMVDQYKIRMAS